MVRQGASALSDAELLAVILRTGTNGKNAVEMGRELMSMAGGSLRRLSDFSVNRLCGVGGIGQGKALQIAAVLELARRMEVEGNSASISAINNPNDAYRLLKGLFTTDRVEECWCIYLKRNRKVLDAEMISRGGETMTHINTRQIVRRAIDLGAAGIVISHNHPSGHAEPSEEDISITEHLMELAAGFELVLMDHIVIAEDGFYSFAQNATFNKSGKKCKKL